MSDIITPYEQGQYDWHSLLPDDNPYEDEHSKAEWERGYWDRDSEHLDELYNATHSPVMVYLSGFIVIIIIVMIIVAVLKTFL